MMYEKSSKMATEFYEMFFKNCPAVYYSRILIKNWLNEGILNKGEIPKLLQW